MKNGGWSLGKGEETGLGFVEEIGFIGRVVYESIFDTT
jgi:hypothetical protein